MKTYSNHTETSGIKRCDHNALTTSRVSDRVSYKYFLDRWSIYDRLLRHSAMAKVLTTLNAQFCTNLLALLIIERSINPLNLRSSYL